MSAGKGVTDDTGWPRRGSCGLRAIAVPRTRGSVAFDEVGAAGGEVVGVGPEVGDLGDLAVAVEVEEAQPGLRAFRAGELDPARRVPAFAGDPLHGQVPVVGEAFHVEPDVGVPAADLL